MVGDRPIVIIITAFGEYVRLLGAHSSMRVSVHLHQWCAFGDVVLLCASNVCKSDSKSF